MFKFIIIKKCDSRCMSCSAEASGKRDALRLMGRLPKGNTDRADRALQDERWRQPVKGCEIFHWREQYAKQCGINAALCVVQYSCRVGVCGDVAGCVGKKKVRGGRACHSETSRLHRQASGNCRRILGREMCFRMDWAC